MKIDYYKLLEDPLFLEDACYGGLRVEVNPDDDQSLIIDTIVLDPLESAKWTISVLLKDQWEDYCNYDEKGN